MMMYRVAVFFAIICGLSGAINSVMDYNVAHGEQNWFRETTNTHQLDNTSLFTQDQIDAMRESSASGGSSTDSGSYGFGITSLLSVMWGMGTGILYIEPKLEDIFVVTDPDTGANLFLPFLWVFQIGIWCIYVIGITQVWRNSNYRYNL